MVYIWLLWAAICATMVFELPTVAGMESISENSVKCSDSDADVVFLIDTTSSNSTAFLVQQHRLLRTLKRLTTVLKQRSVRYGVIAFHRTPELMLELESPFANDSQRVSDLISALRPRQSTSTSVARALDEAMSLFFESRSGTDRRQIIILGHDGVNTDLVAETLEAVSNVEKMGTSIFAVTGSTRANAFALLGYAGSRDRLFVSPADRAAFQEAMDEALGVCEPTSSVVNSISKQLSRRVHGVRGRRAKEEKSTFIAGQQCGFEKVDLVLVLDTSGSVFRVFENQREIALNILDEIPLGAYSDAVQVSVTRFAANADVILPFLKGRALSEIKDAVKEVKFTGQNTRIASAVQIALDEMERAKRPDARQIFVLISDGHGQEYWNIVQATGKRLQETKAELFAVSASQDYNEAELLIYVGDQSRVFVGPKYKGFLPALSSYIKDCISTSDKPSAAVFLEKNSLDLSTTEKSPSAENVTATIDDSVVKKVTASTDEKNVTDVAAVSTTEAVVAEVLLSSTSTVPSEESKSTSTVPSEESTSTTEENLFSSTAVSVDSTTTGEFSVDGNSAEVEEGRLTSEAPPEADDAGDFAEKKRSRLRDLGLSSSSCEVDIVLIIDRSESVEGDFKKEIELTTGSLQLFPVSEFASGRIRVGAVSFANDAKIELPLGRRQREDAVKSLQTIVHTGGTTSSVQGARLAMQQVISMRRPSARLVTLLFTDGHSQDYWRELIETSMRIRDIPNSVLLAITASKEFSQSELQVWAGESSRVFVPNEEAKFLHAVSKEVRKCGKGDVEGKIGEIETIVKKTETVESSGEDGIAAVVDGNELVETTPATDEENLVENNSTATSTVADLGTVEVGSTATVQTTMSDVAVSGTTEVSHIETSEAASTSDSVVETPSSDSAVEKNGSGEEGDGVDDENERKVHGIRTASNILKIAEGHDQRFHTGRLDTSSSCLTDLMFVVDTSTSVEAEFQQQLQLAVDLVKRLPADDFEDRIRVGVVVFNSKATVVLPMGEPRSRSALLDLLLTLRYSGGSTSVASGVNTALDEIERNRRSNARLMVVLLSDGNSQDHWDDVIRSSNRLRSTGAEVYAVTISKIYMFRELELYAGDKLRVYIDARVRQFLEETENGVTNCGRLAKPASSVVLHAPMPCSSLVDLLIVLDSSTVPDTFYQEKQLAIDLLKALPASVFETRLAVSIISFAQNSSVVLPLGLMPKSEIVFELERVSHSTGPASLSKAAVTTIAEIKAHRRKGSRVLVIIVSNGNGGEEKWRNVQKSAASLRTSEAEVYAVALSETANFEKLKAYTGTENNLYLAEKSDKFIQEIGNSVLSCGHAASGVNNIESDVAILHVDSLVKFRSESRRCAYDQMDLVIILDASTSRREVFEHQRELALSLIERLPISANGTGVATGIVSFTAVPKVILPLGGGRDKAEIRSAIESIEYRGGSTLTAQAVDLSVDDLLRGRRKDALQVVVLMNDGISQDTWDRVLSASERLASTKSERFGVALGSEADLRELERYIGRHDRIYRDGSTEKFLNDVVSLLQGEKECVEKEIRTEIVVTSPRPDECSGTELELMVVFDNTKKNIRDRDSVINANRYLLLDVLGSLRHGSRVRVSVISFADGPKVVFDFTDISERDKMFTQIEAINTVYTQPSYAEAIALGVAKIHNEGRANARSALVILGNGNSKDSEALMIATAARIRETPSVTSFAVDASLSTNVTALEMFTGSSNHVYPYEKTAAFAKEINRLASSSENGICRSLQREARGRLHAAAGVEVHEGVYSTPGPLKAETSLQRDALVEPLNVDKINEGKVLLQKKTTTTTTTPSTTTTTTTRTSTTTTKPSTTTLPSTTSRRPTTTQTSTTTPRQTTTTLPSTTARSTRTIIRGALRTSSSTPSTEATTRTTTVRITTTTTPRTTRAPTTPSFKTYFSRRTTEEPVESSTTFKPGCLLDMIVVLDSSGSVEETFLREKELAAGILSRLRIGPNNARVSIIKFAGSQQVKTVWSFANLQSKGKILRILNGIPFTSGTTAIHSALLKALTEYTSDHGARPGHARPVAIIFTDGYAQKSTSEEAAMLRAVIPDTYAIAINHNYPISRPELEVIVGSPDRVFTDSNIGKFHDILEKIARDCIVD